MSVFRHGKPSENVSFSGARGLIAACVSVAFALPANALTLADCDRTTHISHGGEIGHRDLGEGRVAWLDWWSQEGSAKWIVIVDCGPGQVLRFQTAEENMGRRLPFDKTAQATAILERHQSGARAFATFDRMAADLDPIARDIEITTLKTEPCACAALYPEARGDKDAFDLNSG
ncbi:MAG: hypothetical protein AAFY52_00275 [Pseudomonadota bacterium]